MKLLLSLGSLTNNSMNRRQGNLAGGNCYQGISKEKIAQKMSNINSLSAPVSRNQNSHHTEQACVSMLMLVCSSILPEPPHNSEKVYMNNAKARMCSTEAEGS